MKKKLIVSDKVVKYAKARMEGKTKTESKAIAGYSPTTLPSKIETSEAYKGISIKSSLLSHISVDEISKEHTDLIRQNEDKAIKLNGIKLAYERIEPNTNVMEDNEEVTIIMKG